MRPETRARVARQVESLLNLSQVYKTVFSTPEGQRVLNDLSRCYDGSTVGSSPRKSELRAAQRDVLMRIRDLITIAETGRERAGAELIQSPRVVMNHLEPWSSYE